MGDHSSFTYRLPSAAATDNPTVVMDRGCELLALRGDNVKAAKVWIKFYDKATAPASTDTPHATFECVASTPFNIELAEPLVFIHGLSFRIVTGAADNDNTAVAAGDIVQLNLDIDA
jgi:hypothetical protein